MIYCPLKEFSVRTNRYLDGKTEKLREGIECLKEECAWHDPGNNCCCIKTIALELIVANDIRNKGG